MENNLTNKLSQNYLVQQKIMVFLLHIYVLMNLDMTEQTLMIACFLTFILGCYKLHTVNLLFNGINDYKEIKAVSDSMKKESSQIFLNKILRITGTSILILTIMKSFESVNKFVNEYFNLTINMNSYLMYYLLFNILVALLLIAITGRKYFKIRKGSK